MKRNYFYICMTIIIISISFNCYAIFGFEDNKTPYNEGQFVYVYKGKWRPAKVLKIQEYGNTYFFLVTFVGYSTRYNEWVNTKRISVIK